MGAGSAALAGLAVAAVVGALVLVGGRPAGDGAGGGGSAGCDPRPRRAEREYLLSLPDGYGGRRALPLVLELHGSNMTMQAQAAMSGLAGEEPARGDAAAAPDVAGAGATGLAGDDVAFLSALLDHIARELCVDLTRVHATGLSNGAGMATTLGCVLGGRLAAVAPVAGVNLRAPARAATPSRSSPRTATPTGPSRTREARSSASASTTRPCPTGSRPGRPATAAPTARPSSAATRA